MLLSVLSGCSASIDLTAVVINGRIAFVSSNDDFDCVESISVTAETGEAPVAVRGDDVALVQNAKTYWRSDYVEAKCTAKFPVLYGQRVGDRPPLVEAKDLRIGVVYEVTTSGAGAYGGGRFVIMPDRRLKNLPYPSPSTMTGNDMLADVVTNET